MVTNPFDTKAYPTTEPDRIVVGSFTAWKRQLDFASTSYSVRYDLIPRAGGATLTVNGTQNGAYWEFEITAATSSAWTSPAGEYRMNLIIVRSSDSEASEVETSHVTIHASTADRRTHAEIMLAKINSILEGRADHDVDSYTIKDRSISRMSVSELRGWRDYYLDEVQRTGGSQKNQRAAKPNTVRVRFTQ